MTRYGAVVASAVLVVLTLTGCTPGSAHISHAVAVSAVPSSSPSASTAPAAGHEASPAALVLPTAARLALTVIDPFALTPSAPIDPGMSTITQLAAVTGGLGAVTYTSPGQGVFGVLASRTLASPTVLPVIGSAFDGRWLQVEIPSRLNLPSVGRVNGASAWVTSAEVTLRPVGSQITVDLTARTATVLDASGAEVYSTLVAVGADETPTPTGRGFLVDASEQPGSSTPHVLALSMHSAVLNSFDGDVPVVGIHTVSGLKTVGRVSNGCVRLPNDAAFNALNLPPGTPVTIVEGDH
jgi:hypothetical protein